MPMPFDALDDASDEALLVLYANGDRQAAQVLTLRLLPRVLGVARRMLGDASEAEDVAQEAMLRLWRLAPDWQPGKAQPGTWLYRVAANLCIDRMRRRGREAPADDIMAEPADTRPDAEQGMIAAERAAALETALLGLPARQRQAIILRHIEGLSNPEIAAIMETGVEAVESLTARGRRALVGLLATKRAELGYGDD